MRLAGPTIRDEAATARLLEVINRLVVAATLVGLASGALAFPAHLVRFGVQTVATLAVGGAVWWLLRRGQVRPAAVVGLAGQFAFLLVTVATSGGVRGPFVPGFLLCIVLATLVLGARWGLVMTVATTLYLGGLAVLEWTGHLPTPALAHTALSFYLIEMAILLGIAAVQGYLAFVVEAASDRLRQEAEQRHQVEVALQQAQRAEAVGTLARGVAHDFNNILAAILGNAQVLAESLPPGQEDRQAAEEIQQAARRGRDLVRQLLDFSKGRPGERTQVSLEAIAEEVLTLLRASAPATIEFRRAFSPAPEVVADPTQVHQVLVNVITNAVQAMAGSPGVLTVSIRAEALPPRGAGRAAPGRFVAVAVTDTGPGIDPAHLPRIFDPFFTTKPLGQGSGIGLAVVHRLMQGLGGEVRAESQPGRGATFHLRFPVAPPSVRPTVTPPPAVEPVTARRGGHALLVDDEPTVASATARLLRHIGWRVTVCQGSAAADEALRFDVRTVDVVLVDLALPGLDGLSLLAAWRRTRPELPAVLVSGDHAAADPARVAALAPLTRLDKPFSARALGDALETAIRR